MEIEVDVFEVLGNADTYDIISEIESRGYEVIKEGDDTSNENKAFMINRMFFNKDELYRHLCDIVGCGYHEPKQIVLDKLKDMM